MIDPTQAALTAITEAILALDFEPMYATTEADDAIEDAREALLEARALLGAELWPLGMPRPTDEQYATWHATKLADHKAKGIQ